MLFTTLFPVTCHTDHVGIGSTFVAILGEDCNGAKFIPLALERGAKIIVVDQELDEAMIDRITQAGAELQEVFDARVALAELSHQALGHPTQHLKVIGITGTKGKTTTAFLIEHMLRTAGYKTALIGGVKNKILDQEEVSTLTTPPSDYLAMFFAECVKQGVQYVVMEAASHAIAQYRVEGIDFDAICFTNFGSDHLDYHLTQEDYFEAKAHLFSYIKPGGVIVINGDDAWASKKVERIREMGTQHVLRIIGQKPRKALTDQFVIESNSAAGLELVLNSDHVKSQKLFGEFNAYNIIMAVVISKQLGISLGIIQQAIATFPGVPGRLNHYRLKNGAQAFVDFAHNPSSMESVLKALRAISNHLIVVFGCGGNRDTAKRPIMGALAVQYADHVIVTDDNPRHEDRQLIISDILAGIAQDQMHKVVCQPDRRAAIALAAQLSGADSVIALLGKGHETYYLIKDEKQHFDDMEEIKKF